MGRAFEYRKATKLKRWGNMSRVFTKLGKQITIAVRESGADPETYVPYFISGGKKIYVRVSASFDGRLVFIAPVEAEYFFEDNKVNITLPVSAGIFDEPILSLSWLFQLSWLLSGELTFNDGLRIPYMPMHTAGVSLDFPWKSGRNKLRGSLNISGHFESARYTDTVNYRKLDPYFLLNITYNQKLNKNIGIFGKINNVLNTSYVSFIDYPMPGISLSLGMNMIYEGLGSH